MDEQVQERVRAEVERTIKQRIIIELPPILPQRTRVRINAYANEAVEWIVNYVMEERGKAYAEGQADLKDSANVWGNLI